jgi:hypothetical protein
MIPNTEISGDMLCPFFVSNGVSSCTIYNGFSAMAPKGKAYMAPEIPASWQNANQPHPVAAYLFLSSFTGPVAVGGL